jgi:hypothetical protein
MQFQVNEAEVKRAQTPHNLLISGLFLLNLLMAPAMLALKTGMIGLLLPLLSTGTLIFYIYLRSKKVQSGSSTRTGDSRSKTAAG